MTAVSVSLEKDLLNQIDARAKELGISRSVYLSKLAANDMAKGGDFIINKKGKKSVDDPFSSHNRQQKIP